MNSLSLMLRRHLALMASCFEPMVGAELDGTLEPDTGRAPPALEDTLRSCDSDEDAEEENPLPLFPKLVFVLAVDPW